MLIFEKNIDILEKYDILNVIMIKNKKEGHVYMKHIINERENLISDMIDGLLATYNGTVVKVNGVNGIVKNNLKNNKVALVVGGGSGHEPIYHGLIGENMADAAAIGDIFASPNPEIIYETAKAAETGKGVLFVYGNYAGDNMNFDIAAEMLEEDGIKTKTIRINDDVATTLQKERRGIAGLLFIVKIAGSICNETDSLDLAYKYVLDAVANTRSMGVAVQAGTMINTQQPTFILGNDEIEIGMGIHGEPGVSRVKLKSATEIVDEMMIKIFNDLKLVKNEEVDILINDLGAITNMELLIVANEVSKFLKNKNIKISQVIVGKFATTMDMKGFSISLIKLDGERKRLLHKSSDCIAYNWFNK